MPQPPNMNKMLQQMQKMQADMMAAQEQLKHETVEASAGGDPGLSEEELIERLKREYGATEVFDDEPAAHEPAPEEG